MIEIIEHKDYNKPVDNDTVVETLGMSNQKKKLFKVFDGVWIDPDPDYEINADPRLAVKLAPYQKTCCQTIEEKSKYLKQMSILFKRINSVALGQGLLEELYRGSPINFSGGPTWNVSNMVVPRTGDNTVNRKFRATCIIKPMEGFIIQVASTGNDLQENIIDVEFSEILFHPDCIMSIKKDKNICFVDPSIILFHELTHVLHSIYGALALTNKHEEYITYGSKDAQKYSRSCSNHFTKSRNILLKNLKLIKEKISIIEDLEDSKYFKNKYGFLQNTSIDKEFVEKYINKYQFTYTEHKFAKALNLLGVNRTSYNEEFFIPFKLDISDPNIYTVEKGFAKPFSTIEEIQANPSHIFQDLDNFEVQRILSKCFRGEARSKRDIDFKIIPLEPLGEDIDKEQNKLAKNQSNPKRAKRSASVECQDEIIDIIEDLDTVYNKSKEIPRKLLSKHAKEKIINVPEDMELDMPPEDTVVEEEITKLETFKVGELVGIGRITPKDVLNAHRINHDLLEGEEPIYFTSDDFSTSTIAGNQSFTHNKNLSTKMSLMNRGKAVLKTGNAIVNIAQFGMWVDEMIEDFKGDTGKDNLHIANDVLSIVPYLGQVMNIGVDIKDGNYLGAVETLGILVLLEVFPELMLPVFLIGIIVNAIQKNKQQKEMVSKAVWNVLMEREQLLDSQLETEAEHLAHICIERIQKIADHVEQQLTFNAEAIINNIKHYGRKITKNNEDHNKELQRIVYLASTKLGKAIEEKRNKVIETLFTQLKKTIVTDFKEKAQGEIKQFNEQTKTMIKDMLKEHSKDISTSALDEGLKIVEHYMKTHNIGATIKHELDLLVDVIGQGVNIVMHKTGQPLLCSHIGLNKDNKAVDKISNKELKNQNISFAWGRSGNALKFEAGNFLQLQDKLFTNLTLANDFTIEFWIKVPLTKNYDQETTKDIAIIKNGFNHKNGWAFILNGRYLSFILNMGNSQKVKLGTYYVAHNLWTKITLVNRLSLKELIFYVNGYSVHIISTMWISKNYMASKLDRFITIEVPEENKGVEFYLDDFQIRLISLLPAYIKECYEQDSALLVYDSFGNCLTENKEYIITIFDQYTRKTKIVSRLEKSGYLVCDQRILPEERHKHTIKIKLIAKDSDLDDSDQNNIIKKNDNIILSFFNDTLNTDVLWAVNPTEVENNYMIHINKEDKKLPNKHVVYSSNIKYFNIFKIFNMYDYAKMPLYTDNKYSISLALYKEGFLKSLLISHTHGILAVDGLLENNDSSDAKVKLKASYPTEIRDYTYKSLCYLFPVDETEYYSNMYK